MVLQLSRISSCFRTSSLLTWKCNRCSKISDVFQSFQPKNRLQFFDCLVIPSGNQTVYLFNNGINAGNAVLRAILLNGVVPEVMIRPEVNLEENTHHSGYSRASFVGALLAMPPNRTSPYILTENAVSPPARLPPYRIQGVLGAVRLPETPGNVAC